jgi:hypothetical protein
LCIIMMNSTSTTAWTQVPEEVHEPSYEEPRGAYPPSSRPMSSLDHSPIVRLLSHPPRLEICLSPVAPPWHVSTRTLEEWWAFRRAYAEASEQYRAGAYSTRFPAWSLRPPLFDVS